MRNIIKAIIIASVLSIIHFVPVRGQEQKVKIRYTTASLNIRKKPSKKSKIKGYLRYNEKVRVVKGTKKWFKLVNKKGKTRGYVKKKYLSKKRAKSKEYDIPEYSGMKSWMDFRKITDTSSPQWKLQEEYAETGSYGLRTVDGRYCIAIGFAYNPEIGQYCDLILENDTVIPCVISDQKSHYDTTDDMFTTETDCFTEFVVDEESLSYKAHPHGDISDVNESWGSPVKTIKIYTKKNVLEE